MKENDSTWVKQIDETLRMWKLEIDWNKIECKHMALWKKEVKKAAVEKKQGKPEESMWTERKRNNHSENQNSNFIKRHQQTRL